MRILSLRSILAFSVLAILSASAFAQAPPRPPAGPDTPGTGPYPAMKEEDPSLPQHTVYRPKDIAAMAAFLMGEAGRNITGAVITVDAGGTA